MAKTKFKANRALGAQLAASPQYRAGLVKAAEPARRMAQTLAEQAGAPWMRRRGAKTVEIDQDTDGVRLVNTDFAGHLMEWGSRNNPPHAPLRRGAQAAGLRLGNDT